MPWVSENIFYIILTLSVFLLSKVTLMQKIKKKSEKKLTVQSCLEIEIKRKSMDTGQFIGSKLYQIGLKRELEYRPKTT